jgi:hypothetical protein
MLPAASTPF